MKESANKNINEQEKISGVQHRNDSLALNHSENAIGQKQNGLVCVSYIVFCVDINKRTGEEISIEEEICEWSKAGTEIETKIKYLLNDSYSDCRMDCRISLAEYSNPELTEENISRIRACFLFISENENFYYSKLEDAREALLEHCFA